jgi:hypothetical protein
MTGEESEKHVAVCNHPRVEIDAWGQRLHGCIQCNQWMSADGEWLRLPEADIATLRGMKWKRPSTTSLTKDCKEGRLKLCGSKKSATEADAPSLKLLLAPRIPAGAGLALATASTVTDLGLQALSYSIQIGFRDPNALRTQN